MKVSFERRFVIGFIITFVILGGMGLFSFYSTQRLIATSELLRHTLSVVNTAELVLKNIVDLETGERGYVITGDENFLEPFHKSSEPLRVYFARLDSLTKDNNLQQKRVDTLRRLIDRKTDWTTRVIVARASSFEEAKLMVATGDGKKITDSIRSCIKRLQAEESDVFRKGNTISSQNLHSFQLSLISLVVASVVIIASLFYLIYQNLRARTKAEEDLKHSSNEIKASQQRILQMNLELESKVNARTLELKQSQEIYKAIASHIPGSAILIFDRNDKYILVEGDLIKHMGYDREKMLNKKLSEIATKEVYELYRGLFDRAFQGETIIREIRTSSGHETVLRIVPLRNERDEIFSVMTVFIDISEIKRVQEQLKVLNNTLEEKVEQRTEQLNAVNKELEAFTYSVSHDLRAPLRSISGYAQVLKEDYSEIIGNEGVRVTDLIISSGVRMGRLIDDLLTFSRLGRKEISRSHIDMDGMVKSITRELIAAENGRKIKVHGPPLQPATGDPNMIQQVWINLISNALKYSSKKEFSDIEIKSERTGEGVEYSIKDNGAGFDMAYADKLFGVFQRMHRMKDFEGTGVGLALVKTIITRHGGRVWADARVNEGAQFNFTLPD